MNFKLILQDSNLKIRVANYDPIKSTMLWDDNNKAVVKNETDIIHSKPNIFPVSPTSPGSKVKSLNSIKIQMGFACNYTCNYCSQNNLRNQVKENADTYSKKVSNFILKIPTWFGGGTNGLGRDVKIEFWGGETLLYWDGIKKISQFLRDRYPDIHLGLFTNGSLITEEIANDALNLKIHFIISHDGPTFNHDRSTDPLEIPNQRKNLIYLFNLLSPQNLVSFNATLTINNFSLIEIRNYIANKIDTKNENVILSAEVAVPYDSPGMQYVIKSDLRTKILNKIYNEYLKQYPFELKLGNTDLDFMDFHNSINSNYNIQSLGQKCSMDLPTSIAVDIDGNILTCQNVTAIDKHKIGHIDQLQDTKLNTSFHWSTRKECNKCPVVQICKGSCMFLTDKLWTASCDQHFTWSLAFLAFYLKVTTDYKLIKIEAFEIRNREENTIELIS